jgi:hypothetical protein
MRILSASALLLLGASRPSSALQTGDGATTPAATVLHLPPNAAVVPFSVGEKLEYDVKFSSIKIGSGSVQVKELADVRGFVTWHTVFNFSGGIPFYHIDDSYESWFDVVTLNSLRFHQDLNEGSYKPRRHYEIFPDRSVFRINEKPEEPSVNAPLDDGSFLYFVRTIPLEVGKTYSFPRHFNPASNPVEITVLRRDTIDVPAGKFATLVLRPTFQSKGIFGKDGKAEVWVSDDERRIIVQMKSKLSIGSINLYLRKHNTKAAK